MENRIGKFYITEELILDNIKDIEEIFCQLRFVPVRTELVFPHKFEYIGVSHMFREVDQDECVPEYNIISTRNEDKTITVSVKELDK